MSNVKMCVGARSDTPYYMKHFDTQLYSIEELCYIITQNAFCWKRKISMIIL